MKKIHVGFLLSFDYKKLQYAVPPVYDAADAIFIAKDKEQRLWSGKRFEIDDSFYKWLKAFDVQNKIQIYEDDFYVPELSTIENDTRERKMLSEKMGIGNWLIQVDADEYFLDFPKFVLNLKKYDHFLDCPEKNKVQVAAFLLNMYKHTDEGVFFVKNPTRVLIATNYPNYKAARQTKQRIIYTDNLLLHECLARDEDELLIKLNNWGHNKDIDLPTFMDKWRSVNQSNYKKMKDFFYLEPWKWKELEFAQGRSLEDFKKYFADAGIRPSRFFLLKKNFGQYFKHLFKK